MQQWFSRRGEGGGRRGGGEGRGQNASAYTDFNLMHILHVPCLYITGGRGRGRGGRGPLKSGQNPIKLNPQVMKSSSSVWSAGARSDKTAGSESHRNNFLPLHLQWLADRKNTESQRLTIVDKSLDDQRKGSLVTSISDDRDSQTLTHSAQCFYWGVQVEGERKGRNKRRVEGEKERQKDGKKKTERCKDGKERRWKK